MELGGKPVPKPLEPLVIGLRDRVKELEQRYGSLSKWGRPIFFDIKEVATIYWLNEKIGISLDRLSHFLGLDKTSLYKVVRRIKEEGKVSIYDTNENRVKTVSMKPEELLDVVEEIMGVTTKQKIMDPFQSNIVRKFWESRIEKRAKLAGKPAFLSDKIKRETIRIISDIMSWLKDNRPNVPTNPDYWTPEIVEDALWSIYKDYRRVAEAMIALRRIPEWNTWFKGRIGAVTKRINPRLSVLFYNDYLKIKRLYNEGKIGEGEFLAVWLHITTGAREGYTLYSEKLSLDNPEVNSSLIGLRWENLSKVGDSYILKIYESKTAKWWTCDLSWLDDSVIPIFLKYAREKGNIMKDLLGVNTVGEFRERYRNIMKKLSKLLELPFELKPHDLRRSHLSILAELGIPMEYSISGYMDFGVGWEDAKTALVFYLRFSKYTKEVLKKQIEERKKLIANYG